MGHPANGPFPDVKDLPRFVEAASSKEDILYHDLEEIDLSLYDKGPDARKRLAGQVEDALRTQGFLYLVNTGFPQEKYENLQAISQALLNIPLEEQLQYLAASRYSDEDSLANGDKPGGERGAGFKPQEYWAMKNGVRDNITLFNMRNILHPELRLKEKYPPIAVHYFPYFVEYYEFLHYQVIPKLTDLIEQSLGVPRGTIQDLYDVKLNEPQKSGGGIARTMLYHGMTPEEEAKVDNEWLRGHSDAAALTLLTSQPIVSLQFRDYHDGRWKYVKHVPGALIVNVGDQLEFLTGSYYKATIHRVVKPPADQLGKKRLTLIYFSDFKPDTLVDPETIKSPRLEALGYARPEGWTRISSIDWTKNKAKLFGKPALNAAPGDKPYDFLIAGRLAERWHQNDGAYRKKDEPLAQIVALK